MNYLVVSLHDAAPPYLEKLKEMTSWLDHHSILPRCIKVVPNYQGRWNILHHKDFMDWLLKEKGKGSELIQHGYTHRAQHRPNGWIDILREKCITNHESEFLAKDYEKLRESLVEGRRILEEAGIQSSGFTSPTWHQSQEATQALRDSGFRYFTTISSIFDCEKQSKIFSMAMGFQGVNSLLEYLNMAGNSLMRRTGFLCSPLARMVLHPCSLCANFPFAQALKGVLRLSQKRKLVTYCQYLNLRNGE